MGWWYFKLNYLHFILFLVECFETDFQTKGRFVEPGPRAGGERGAPAFQPRAQPKEEPAWQRAGCPPTRLPIGTAAHLHGWGDREVCTGHLTNLPSQPLSLKCTFWILCWS